MTGFDAVLAIALMSGVTMLLRYIPFLAFGRGKETPKLVVYLGKVLPYAIMAMLIVYCLKDMEFSGYPGYVSELMAVVIVVALHVYKRNALLSIAAGTVCYMVLVQFVFS